MNIQDKMDRLPYCPLLTLSPKLPPPFLDAPSHLYKRVCPYVRPSVRMSVRPSMGPSVGPSVCPSVNTKEKPPKTTISACETHLIARSSLFSAKIFRFRGGFCRCRNEKFNDFFITLKLSKLGNVWTRQRRRHRRQCRRRRRQC